MFSYEIYEIFKNTYLEEHLRTADFENKEIIFHLHRTVTL